MADQRDEIARLESIIGALMFALDEAEAACKAEAKKNADARLTAGVRAGTRDIGKFAKFRMAIRCKNHIARARFAALDSITRTDAGGGEDG